MPPTCEKAGPSMRVRVRVSVRVRVRVTCEKAAPSIASSDRKKELQPTAASGPLSRLRCLVRVGVS